MCLHVYSILRFRCYWPWFRYYWPWFRYYWPWFRSYWTLFRCYLTWFRCWWTWFKKAHIFLKCPLKFPYVTDHNSDLPNIPPQKPQTLLNIPFDKFIFYLTSLRYYWTIKFILFRTSSTNVQTLLNMVQTLLTTVQTLLTTVQTILYHKKLILYCLHFRLYQPQPKWTREQDSDR